MKTPYFVTILLVGVGILMVPGFCFAVEIKTPLIKVFETQTYSEVFSFEPFSEVEKIHSIDLEVEDLNKDGRGEFIVAAGGEAPPLIKIFSPDGVLFSQFLAYADFFKGGVNITVKDIDLDGHAEIITAAQNNGGPHVRIFDLAGNSKGGFFAFDQELSGGVNLGVGELNQSEGLEIVTASGNNMEPLIRIYNRYGDLLSEFTPDFAGIKYGLNVQVLDLDGNGEMEILVSAKAGYAPIVKSYTPEGIFLRDFLAYQNSFQGGVNLEFTQLLPDSGYEIITGAGFGGGAHVRFFNYQGGVIINPSFFVFDEFGGGVLVETGNITNDRNNEIVVATQYLPDPGKDKNLQMIEVDLKKQEMVTYEFGRERDRSLVSSGLSKYPTPKGSFKVTAKIPEKDYNWAYGVEHPDNYEIPKVKDNLMFRWPFYLHGAYWHNNFGKKMSHGCVNLPLDYAAKLYAWANEGAVVDIFESQPDTTIATQ